MIKMQNKNNEEKQYLGLVNITTHLHEIINETKKIKFCSKEKGVIPYQCMISIYLRNIFGKGEKPLGSDFPDHCSGENSTFLIPSDVSIYNTCMASPQRRVQAESRKDSQCQARSFFTESNPLNQCERTEH